MRIAAAMGSTCGKRHAGKAEEAGNSVKQRHQAIVEAHRGYSLFCM
jgi:hypothetical protein